MAGADVSRETDFFEALKINTFSMMMPHLLELSAFQKTFIFSKLILTSVTNNHKTYLINRFC
jgi:hypothetical protein